MADALSITHCEDCYTYGLRRCSTGFCTTCDLNLCSICIEEHCSSEHSASEWESDTPPLVQRKRHNISTSCKEHAYEPITSYCTVHALLLCSVCLKEDHMHCSEIEDIYEASKSVFKQRDFRHLYEKLTELRNEIDDENESFKTNLKRSERRCDYAINSFQRYKEEVIEALEDIEKAFTCEVEKRRSEYKEKMENQSESCDNLSEQIESYKEEFRDLPSSKHHLYAYICWRSVSNEIDTFKSRLYEIRQDNHANMLVFVRNEDLVDCLKNTGAFGYLKDACTNKITSANQSIHTTTEGVEEQRPNSPIHTRPFESDVLESFRNSDSYFGDDTNSRLNEQLQTNDQSETVPNNIIQHISIYEHHVSKAPPYMAHQRAKTFLKSTKINTERAVAVLPLKTLNIKSQYDTLSCRITGISVLSNSRIVVLDRRNRRVKLVDSRNSSIIAELIVHYPRDITVINETQVAMTVDDTELYDKSFGILMLEVSNIIRKEKNISVSGVSRGIAFSDGFLYVTFIRPAKVDIMDLNGNVMKTIQDSANNGYLFERPKHVCENKFDGTVYITDFNAGIVFSLTKDGIVKTRIVDNERENFDSFCIDTHGNVFVHGRKSKSIHMIPRESSKSEIVLSEINGLTENVSSISHCNLANRLYIGLESGKVGVYQILIQD